MKQAYIVDAVRTPIGKRNGALSEVLPGDLLAAVLNELVQRSGVSPVDVDDHIAGCVGQVGPQGYNIARWAWLSAGLSKHVPSMTIDRQCGSSQQAIHNAAQAVMSGQQHIVVASGVEVMSQVPLGASIATLSRRQLERLRALPIIGKKLRSIPLAAGNPFASHALRAHYPHLVPQGISAGYVAEKYDVSREMMDAYALRSHRRLMKAQEENRFASQMISPDRELVLRGLDHDEGVRPDTSLEVLSGLRESFEEGSGITAGNSSQISDGAAAVLIASREAVDAYGFTPRARINALSVVGSDPVLMLSGPISATRDIMGRMGWHADFYLRGFDVIEINEAFASVVLAWKHALGIPDDWFDEHVNPNGGAIAHGHPLGATGAILMTKLLNELERREGRYGLQTMCEGGGMANATVIERLS